MSTVSQLVGVFMVMFTSTSCTPDLVQEQSTVLTGVYEVDRVTITFEDGTESVFSSSANTTIAERLVFTETEVTWYMYQNDEWVDKGSNVLSYRDGQLIKIGCRPVVEYSDKHIIWEQDEWLVRRDFK